MLVSSPSSSASISWRLYAGWATLCCIAFGRSIGALARYATQNETASHIVLIPFIFAWLLYSDRKKIVFRAEDRFLVHRLVSSAGALAACLVGISVTKTRITLPTATLILVFFLVAGFLTVFGLRAAKAVSFSLAFLLFLVPIPDFLLNHIIYWLQRGSASIVEVLFDWTGVPVLREGFIFHLPKLSIEVAHECSGIRSSMALLILALLVAHFSFSKFWKRALFVFAGLLMMFIKNGIRIVTLTLLANYVDPDFLYSGLHRKGGVVFFLIGLVLLWPVYWWLRRGERPPAVSSLKTVGP